MKKFIYENLSSAFGEIISSFFNILKCIYHTQSEIQSMEPLFRLSENEGKVGTFLFLDLYHPSGIKGLLLTDILDGSYLIVFANIDV